MTLAETVPIIAILAVAGLGYLFWRRRQSPHATILDFDGTFTDAEKEGAGFIAAYLDILATVTGVPRYKLESDYNTFTADMLADPAKHPFIFNDRAVAPGSVDPYLRASNFARATLKRLGRAVDGNVLQEMYRTAYEKSGIAFRPHAVETILAAKKRGGVYVVTNSKTEAVQSKLRQLGFMYSLPEVFQKLIANTIGNAGKFLIDDQLNVVPAELRVNGLDRPILLRRGNYYNVLNKIRRDLGLGWAQMTVVGDIFELDLALPAALNMRIILVANDCTPRYEIDYIEKSGNPNWHVAYTLEEAKQIINQAA